MLTSIWFSNLNNLKDSINSLLTWGSASARRNIVFHIMNSTILLVAAEEGGSRTKWWIVLMFLSNKTLPLIIEHENCH